MKIKICCDNGANCQSKKCAVVTTEDVGFTESEWQELSEDAKQKEVVDYVDMAGWIDIWFEEQ